MSNQECEEKEINLRDYINVIIKRKKIILAIFLVSVIATAIYSLLLPKIYRASVLLMITPSKLENIQSYFELMKSNAEGFLTQKPSVFIITHKTIIKSNTVLERIIDKLKLTDITGDKLLPENLSNKLDVKEVKDTNILQLEVTGPNPKDEKEIANTWAQEYIMYNQGLISGELKGTGDFITDQFEIVKKNLIQCEEKVKEFKDKSKIDLMRAEIDIKKGKLSGYKNELIGIDLILKTKGDFLREVKTEIEKQERFIIVSKAITDDALWQQVVKEKTVSDLGKKKLRSEEINPIYQDLETKIVNTEIELNTLRPKREYLKNSVTLTEEEIDGLERTINQNEFELTQLNRQVEIYKRTYDTLSAKIEEARIATSSQLGEVKVLSPAIEPKNPIGPKKRQMVATSGIVGLFIGIFFALFTEYWQSSKTKGVVKV